MISGNKWLWSGRKVETVFWYSCPCLKVMVRSHSLTLETFKSVRKTKLQFEAESPTTAGNGSFRSETMPCLMFRWRGNDFLWCQV